MRRYAITGIIIFLSGMFASRIYLFAADENYEMASSLGRPDIKYVADGLRDPFANIFKKTESSAATVESPGSISPPGLTVQGVIWGDGPSRAIINNKVVSIGDTIEGAKIIDIGVSGVSVLYNGRQYNFNSPAKTNLESVRNK